MAFCVRIESGGDTVGGEAALPTDPADGRVVVVEHQREARRAAAANANSGDPPGVSFGFALTRDGPRRAAGVALFLPPVGGVRVPVDGVTPAVNLVQGR